MPDTAYEIRGSRGSETLKTTNFWDVGQYGLVSRYRRFDVSFFSHLRSIRVKMELGSYVETSIFTKLHGVISQKNCHLYRRDNLKFQL
jgi:hypothetical protein